MANPRELKKFYMKIFQGNEEIYQIFVKLYDQAVEDGSAIPEEVAWIQLRKRYIETDEGWVEL